MSGGPLIGGGWWWAAAGGGAGPEIRAGGPVAPIPPPRTCSCPPFKVKPRTCGELVSSASADAPAHPKQPGCSLEGPVCNDPKSRNQVHIDK